MAKTLVETYLDCQIFYYTPPDVPSASYGSPCISGLYFKISAVKKRICEGKGGTWDGVECSFAPGPPPPPEPPPEGVKVLANVTPAVGGFIVQLWWHAPHNVWMHLEDKTTNVMGIAFWLYDFTSYPQELRVFLPAGQVIDGVEYRGDTSREITVTDGTAWDLFLYPEVVSPEPPPEPPPDETEYVETYRGVMIWQYKVSGWYTFTYNVISYDMPPPIADVYAKIDELIAEDEEPYVVEVYREVQIWWKPKLDMFWAQVAPGFVALADTLPKIKVFIDEIIEFLETPKIDPGAILAQLFNQVMIWVESNMSGWLQPVYSWIDTVMVVAKRAWEDLVAGAVDLINQVSGALTNLGNDVRDRWDNFTTSTLPGIYSVIATQIGQVSETIEVAKFDMKVYVDTSLLGERAWVAEFFKLMDPFGFLKDPLGYIKAAIALQREIAELAIVKSFWEGFEEGLETG